MTPLLCKVKVENLASSDRRGQPPNAMNEDRATPTEKNSSLEDAGSLAISELDFRPPSESMLAQRT